MTEEGRPLSLPRNLKIGLFHLGSGIADVLTTGVWNRIMISDLGFSATPVALLLSLRYFLIPIGIWSGEVSDRRRILGTRRLFWIWSGRLLMLLGTLLMGWQTAELARSHFSVEAARIASADWLILALALLLFSIGSALSGSTFLALLYDRAPANQRGQVVGIVWAFLLLGFTVAGIFFGILLPDEADALAPLSPATLRSLFYISAGVIAVLWFISLLGEERHSQSDRASANTALRRGSGQKALAQIWQQAGMRYFLLFLIVSFVCAFMQDIILEPFAGEVFGQSPEQTARFSAYWGGMSILSTVLALALIRRVARITHGGLASAGTILLALSFLLFVLAAFRGSETLMRPGLLLMGTGLGIWNVGTLGLMMDYSPSGRAGAFMGIWTVVITLARGGGVLAGGLLRDALLALGLPLASAYGGVFLVEIIGLAGAVLLLMRLPQSAHRSAGEGRPSPVSMAILAEGNES